ncbi:MAG: putative glycosyltransferase EpsJ [Pseudomonadota bacterium]|jgi:hypothetical protein
MHSAPFPSPTAPTANPRVCAIVPAYGVAHLLGEALESLLSQTMHDWECIVIDDGAPDDVAAAVAPYLHDPRIRFMPTDNRGVGGARNRAIAASRATLLTLLDADDMLCPRYFEKVLPALEGDPHNRLATPNARIFGAIERERHCVSAKQGTGDGIHGSLADVIDRSFNVYIGSTFRREDWAAIDGFDETMTHCEDLDFWVRLMSLGGTAFYIDEVLGEYRVRPGSASGAPEKMIRGNLHVYRKAAAALAGRPEAAVAERMIRLTEADLAFEQAMVRVAAGDVTQGLPALRVTSANVSGPIWALAFALWRVAPALAPPMIRWRRRNHARGGSDALVPPIHVRLPAASHTR